MINSRFRVCSLFSSNVLPEWCDMFVDVVENRLRTAKEMGAAYVMKVDTKDSKLMAQKLVEQVGSMVDITIECSGAESSVQTGIYVRQPNQLLSRLVSRVSCLALSRVWPGLAWPGLAWPGLAWPGLAWPGLAWPGLAWPVEAAAVNLLSLSISLVLSHSCQLYPLLSLLLSML